MGVYAGSYAHGLQSVGFFLDETAADSYRLCMRAWNGWYHCTASTYGTWLRGDPRGWRARHHREHVLGDYRSPPPKGMYGKLHERSKKLMKRGEVHIVDPRIRQIVVDEFVKRLQLAKRDVIIA